MNSTTKVALLGLGTMGAGMAGSLLKAGFTLTVYNRTFAKAEALTTEGATAAATPRTAVAGADVVVSMVADDQASGQIWLGENGALAGIKTGAVAVECSTLSPGWVRELAALVERTGCELLDAPVTGTKPHAAAGQLLFLVGGSDAALAACRPVLASMSRDIVHVGPIGSGAILKLINNFVCGVQVASIAEGLALIERSGLNVEKALSVLTNGAPGSPLVKLISTRMTAKDYAPNFYLKLMCKDLSYAIDEAKKHGMMLETAGGALNLMQGAVRAGHGEQDFSAMIETLREQEK
jgi:3-hydroxyisobutyrate dehydrogenase